MPAPALPVPSGTRPRRTRERASEIFSHDERERAEAEHAGGIDRTPAVDRDAARRNISAGMMAAGVATAIFCISFVAALLYIAQ